MAVIDMQTIRNINLFEKVTRVKTKWCFPYSNSIVFVLRDKRETLRASELLKQKRELVEKTLGKRVKLVWLPRSNASLREFVEEIVAPTKFKDLVVEGNKVTIVAGTRQSKGLLIGREKARLNELKRILNDVLGKELEIV
ncbi:hypothetical protein D6817_02460 [Candidatus Pacearchaeota archaeon]|nr:MAG: hypothetical protein D6817_02460 [Candidatus Pacearchaeota archaeon]